MGGINSFIFQITKYVTANLVVAETADKQWFMPQAGNRDARCRRGPARRCPIVGGKNFSGAFRQSLVFEE